MTAGEGAPLTGCRVLLTRPAGRGEVLGERLRAIGARVELRPTIALEPPSDPGPARRSLARLGRFDWVVFTSATGVRFFLHLLAETREADAAIPCRIAAIGPGTARELEQVGKPVDLVARDARSEGLARALARRVRPGERALVVRPEVARSTVPDALRAHGVRVEAVVFYRNAPAPGLEKLVREVCGDRFDVVVFTSPSTLSRLLDAGAAATVDVRAALRRTRLVAIGPVTARAIEQAGLEPAAVAAEPDDDAVVRAIRSLFA